MRERFTQEEANEILLRAVECQPLGREITREQLLNTAAEIGISPETLRLAEDKWLSERGNLVTERRAFELHQRRQASARLRLTLHFAVYLSVNLFCIFANASEGDFPWSLGILLPWTVMLVFHARRVRESHEERQERAFRRWLQARAAGFHPSQNEWPSSETSRLLR